MDKGDMYDLPGEITLSNRIGLSCCKYNREADKNRLIGMLSM